MKTRNDIVCWLFCFSMCLTGVFGCSQFDADENALVFPAREDARSFSNFQAGELASERLEWSLGQNEFCLNIPEAGDYLLTYVTVKSGSSPLMTGPSMLPLSSAIAFRATAPASVSISLQEGDSVDQVALQRGTIKYEAVGLYDDGPIIRYAGPSIPTIFWKDVLTLAPDPSPLVLERGDLPCPPLMSSELEWR